MDSSNLGNLHGAHHNSIYWALNYVLAPVYALVESSQWLQEAGLVILI